MPKVLIKGGTRAQLDAAAASGQLLERELYYLADDDRLVIGTSANTWSGLSKQVARVVYRGTWASRPTSGLSSGDLAWMEDIGVGGALMYWNASTSAWRATSPIILYARHGSLASPLATITGVTTVTPFVIPGGAGNGIRIPAGLLAGGAICEVSAIVRRKTNSGTNYFHIWINKEDLISTGWAATVLPGIEATVGREFRFLNEFTVSDSGVLTRDNLLAPVTKNTNMVSDVTLSYNNSVELFVGAALQTTSASDIAVLVRFSVAIK